MSSSVIRVSIATVCFNHSSYLESYILSLKRSRYPIAEIIVVDNNSTDNSVEILRNFPTVKTICNPKNVGYSLGLNQAFTAATSSLVCVTGPDIVVSEDWLWPLIETYLSNPEKIFAITSHVRTLDGYEIQSSGSSLHFTGHLNVDQMWKQIDGEYDHDLTSPKEVGAIDSTSALIDKAKFISVGGCDPTFFVYHEEFDYCYRARMRGWQCWYQPRSVVFHGVGTKEFSVRSQGNYPRLRPYLHTKNRFISILKNFQWRTLICILPVFLPIEILNFLVLLRLKLAGAYLTALFWVWKNRREILAKRKNIQETRKVKDNRLLTADPLSISPILLNSVLMRNSKKVIDYLLSCYWNILKLVLY